MLEPLRKGLFECINAVLVLRVNPTHSWLGGLNRFLFKKGNLLEMGNCLSVCKTLRTRSCLLS